MNSKYFIRRMPWTVSDEGQVTLHDSITEHAPRVITMEPWHQVIYMAADGQHRISEFVEQLGSEYENGSPPGLEAQIMEIVDLLVVEQLLEVCDEPKNLPSFLIEDYFSETAEVRNKQMRAAGYIA